jgi:hypothetical protein
MVEINVLFYYESEGRSDDKFILLNKEYGLHVINTPGADARCKYVLYDYKIYFKTSVIDTNKYVKIKVEPSTLVQLLPKLPKASYEAIMIFLPKLECKRLTVEA